LRLFSSVQRPLNRLQSHGDGLTDLTGVEQLLGLGHGRVVLEILEDAQVFSRTLGRVDHGVAFGDVQCHRLLHRDVLSGLESVHRHGRVKMVRGDHFDRVDRRLGQHFAVVGEPALDAPFLGTSPGDVLIDVTDRVHFRFRVVVVRQSVKAGDATSTDDSNS